MLRNAVIYLGSSIVNKAAPFLLLPFMTRFLSPEQFGVLSIFIVINSMVFSVVGMNAQANITKRFFSSTREEIAGIIGNVIFVVFSSSCFVLMLCLILMGIKSSLFSVPTWVWAVCPVLSFIVMVNTVVLTILRNEGKPFSYGAFEISNTFLSLLITIALVILTPLGWYSQMFGLVVSNFLMFVFSLFYLFKRGLVFFSINKKVIRSILKISLPFIPHTVASMIISFSDRVFIEKMVGLDSVATYSIGYSFGMIVGVFADSFIKSWSPWFYKNIKNPVFSLKVKVVRITYLYVLGVFSLGLIVSFVSMCIIPYIVAGDFVGATDFVLWVSMGCAVQSAYKIFFPYLVISNNTHFLAVSTLASAMLNLLLNYYFILQYGPIGAAYSTLLAYLLSAFLVFSYQAKKFSMPWLLRK